MLIEFCDIVEVTWDLAHFQLGVNIVIPLWKTALMLVVKVWPKKREKRVCMFANLFFSIENNGKRRKPNQHQHTTSAKSQMMIVKRKPER